MATIPIVVGAINVGVAKIIAADTTTQKTLFTAGALGSKLFALNIASDDTAAMNVQFSILRSSVNTLLGTINVPALSGSNGTAPSVDGLNDTLLPGLPKDNDGQHYLPLMSGDVLQAKVLVTVTAAKTVHLLAIGGDL